MSEVSPWSVIQSIAERRIEESMAKGDFDDLPGRGRPLDALRPADAAQPDRPAASASRSRRRSTSMGGRSGRLQN